MGSSEPFIVPKRVAGTTVSLVRGGLDLIFNMQGCFYIYYIKGVPEPVSKMHMTASLVATELSQLFRMTFGQPKESEEVDIKSIWVIYQNSHNKNVKAVCLNKR